MFISLGLFASAAIAGGIDQDASAGWRMLTDDPRQSVSLDTASPQRDGPVVTYRLMMQRKTPAPHGVVRMINTSQLNCITRERARIFAESYLANGTMHSEVRLNGKWSPAPDSRLMGLIFQAACEKK